MNPLVNKFDYLFPVYVFTKTDPYTEHKRRVTVEEKVFRVGEKAILLQIYDGPTFGHSLYAHTKPKIFMYDIQSQASFDAIRELIRTNEPMFPGGIRVLAGNCYSNSGKISTISTTQHEQLAQEMRCTHTLYNFNPSTESSANKMYQKVAEYALEWSQKQAPAPTPVPVPAAAPALAPVRTRTRWLQISVRLAVAALALVVLGLCARKYVKLPLLG